MVCDGVFLGILQVVAWCMGADLLLLLLSHDNGLATQRPVFSARTFFLCALTAPRMALAELRVGGRSNGG